MRRQRLQIAPGESIAASHPARAAAGREEGGAGEASSVLEAVMVGALAEAAAGPTEPGATRERAIGEVVPVVLAEAWRVAVVAVTGAGRVVVRRETGVMVVREARVVVMGEARVAVMGEMGWVVRMEAGVRVMVLGEEALVNEVLVAMATVHLMVVVGLAVGVSEVLIMASVEAVARKEGAEVELKVEAAAVETAAVEVKVEAAAVEVKVEAAGVEVRVEAAGVEVRVEAAGVEETMGAAARVRGLVELEMGMVASSEAVKAGLETAGEMMGVVTAFAADEPAATAAVVVVQGVVQGVAREAVAAEATLLEATMVVLQVDGVHGLLRCPCQRHHPPQPSHRHYHHHYPS